MAIFQEDNEAKMSEEQIKKLLDLLNLNQNEFELWLYANKIIRHHPTDESRIESLADMAFRLRDEVGDKPAWWTGLYLVYVWHHTPKAKRKIAHLINEARTHWNYWEDYASWIIMAEPKVFIIAAFIAKELK